MRLLLRRALAKPVALTPFEATALHGVYFVLAAAAVAACQAILHATVVSGIPQVSWQEVLGAAAVAASTALVSYLHSLFPDPAPQPNPPPPAH